jgi:hypothetical protein
MNQGKEQAGKKHCDDHQSRAANLRGKHEHQT